MPWTFNEIGGDNTDVSDSALVRHTRVWRGIYREGTPAVPAVNVSSASAVDAFSTATSIRRFSPYVGVDGRVDTACRASAINAERTDNLIEWIITVPFTTMRLASAPNLSPRQQRERAAMARHHGQTGEQPHQNPTQRQPVLRIGSQEYEESIIEDAIEEISPGVKKPLWNAARERYSGLTKPVSLRTVTYERNETLFSSDFTHDFENTVNNATWYGYAPKTVLCKAITADADWEGQWDFWRVTYLFWVRKDNWMLKLVNEGTYALAVAGEFNKLWLFTDSRTSGGLGSVRPLAADGTALPEGQMPNKLQFNRYPVRDFTLLGLGGG
jgi:hypothetical protein